MTIKELEKKYLGRIAPLDQELLFSSVLKRPREFVLSHPEKELKKSEIKKIISFIKRRLKGEPVAYILGHREFYGSDFTINKNVLIPRPETELLVEEALAELRSLLRNKLRNILVVDVGTGSGNIIISVVKELKKFKAAPRNCQFWGIDVSAKALKLAQKNAQKHQLTKKIKFARGNLLKPIPQPVFSNPQAKIILLANLPYLDRGWKNLLKSTETQGLKYEPSVALYAGRDGLAKYRRLASQLAVLKAKYKPNLTLFCEIGHLQRAEMAKIFSFASKRDFFKDLAGKWRLGKIEL